MSVPLIKTAFTTGEVSPSLFGHVDLARMGSAASTMRNMFVGYRGGSYSRAGTKFVGFSKQTGQSSPPRLIPFQFSINQGLALEFGNQYMRVISNGGYVTEAPFVITNATQANPCRITASAIYSAQSAVPVNSGVSASYATGDTVTLDGGTFTVRSILTIGATTVVSLAPNAAGSGYTPGDQIQLAGGTASSRAAVLVLTTKIVSASTFFVGVGGTPGVQTLTGLSGTGTKYTLNVTVSGAGHVSAINSFTGGSYSVNPSSRDYALGGGFPVAVGNTPQFDVTMGVNAVIITSGGVFSANPGGAAFTQFSTTGSGTGATFNTAVMGISSAHVTTAGSYTVIPSDPVAQFATSGTGAGVLFDVTWLAPPTLQGGDWVYIANIGGMTQLNGRTYVIENVSGGAFDLYDVYGATIDSTGYTAYTSGGVSERIYTLSTPYSQTDLPYLKWTQSADVMSICCVNQITGTEYLPYELVRNADNNWSINPLATSPTVSAPSGLAGSGSAGTGCYYAYEVTAVNQNDGSESIASAIGRISNTVNIAATAGTITLTWNAVAGVNQYNVYKATPTLDSAGPSAGSLFGYAGSAYGTQFSDSNIIADFTQVPPLHANPFARGQILAATPTLGGASYTAATVATISTSTGFGAVLVPIIVSGALAAIVVRDPGQGYLPADTVVITDGGGGSGAAASLTVGPNSGTYPSVPAYFQGRRAYANTLNNPDTYFFSQPGSYTNFDYRIPTIATDAIIGSPWAVQVNGIQWMVPMPGGLVVLTGLSAWQLTGSGGGPYSAASITPATQQAQPQAYNGVSPTVPPLRITDDIIYVQSKGSIIRGMAYQFSSNIYTGADFTINSNHLFTDYTIIEMAWCEEPLKIVWAVRDDGVMLSLTYLKAQEVIGWARHDTKGTFVSVCSVTEPPVDALYCAVQRPIGSNIAYTIERMDNRAWSSAEDCWCVDCGLALSQPTPNATIAASSATGLGSVDGATNLIGGSGYSAGTTAVVVDANGQGPGTGAVPMLTIVGGVITAVAFGIRGSRYVSPKLVISDPAGTGSGASADLILDNGAVFTTSVGVFSVGSIGSVIRMGGGIAVISTYTNSQQVTANILSPIVDVIPGTATPQQQPSGQWTLTAPVTTISGLGHLAGATVTGLADGNVIPPTTVSAAGTITLGTPASAVTVGLGFQAQMQSVYLEAGQPSIQGQRKKIAAATVRIEASRGVKAGANQLDGSVQSPPQIAPTWNGLATVPDDGPNFPPKPYNALATPLRTGDIRVPLSGGYATPGQVAVQQDYPLPLNVLAFIPEMLPGDSPQLQAPKRGRQGDAA